MFFFGVAIGVAMFFLSMPNPLLWGVMAGLFHFIPFLGAMVRVPRPRIIND